MIDMHFIWTNSGPKRTTSDVIGRLVDIVKDED